MKKLLLLIFTIVLFESVQAQIPQTLNYQGIARNANGEPIRYQEISVRISIIDSALAGKVAYQETRRVRTNYVGLFNIVIGSPDAFYVLGNISGVDWATGNKHIKLEIDPAGQSNFTIAGITKLQSVPYALYSTPSGNASGDLTGNYPAPSIASKAVTNSKLADGSVTDIKVAMGINPAKVGLEKVNNTADIDKPISAATQVSLNTKLNIVDTSTMLSNRFNRDTGSLSNRINLKSNTADVNEALALKANSIDVNTALALKANTSDVNAVLALKENLINKSIDIAADGTSDSKYPSVKSVKTYVDQIAGTILTGQVNADWTATVGPAKILNKPSLFSGSYADLTNKPTIPAPQVNADWTATVGPAKILNKPSLFSGAYSDLTGKPSLFSGAYADLTGTIPIWNQNTTGNAATATKLAAPKNINGIAFDGSADITITAAASTLSGTVPVAKGGTGANTSEGARTNLGLVIGTDVMSATATTTLTGDVTGTGSGTFSTTLSNSGVTAGSYGSTTAIPTFTVDAKGRLTAASIVGITAGVSSLNYTSATSYAAGGTISGTALTLAAADGTNPGLISTGAQTIAGAKTFSSTVTAPNFIGDLSGNSTTATTSGNITATANTTLTSLSNLNTVGTITSGTWSGTTIAVANGGTGLTSVTSGQILFGNGTNALGTSSNLFWDNTNSRLGVGTNTPGNGFNTKLDIVGRTSFRTNGANSGLIFDGYSPSGNLQVARIYTEATSGTPSDFVLGTYPNGHLNQLFLKQSNGFVGIRNANPTSELDVSGTVTATSFSGPLTGNASSATALAAGRTISITGDVSYTSPSFDGSSNVTAAATLTNTTVTAGSYGSTTAIPTFTVDAKGRLTAASIVGITAGVSSLNYTSATSYAAGGTISGTALTLAAADGTNPGLISTGAQTIAGAKTFSSTTIFNEDIKVNDITIGVGRRDNTSITSTALGKLALGLNTTGSGNTALGQLSMSNNTTGGFNSATGSQSLGSNTTGSFNTAFGNQTLNSNTTGTYNTAIGFLANVSSGNLTNATAIGNNALVTASNTIQLGNSSITSVKTSGAFNAPIYSSTPQTLTAGSNISWNPMSGLNASVTLNGNSTLAFSELPPVGSSGTLIITQPTSGGTFSLTLPTATTNRVLGSSSGITLSSTNSAKDILSFYYDGNAFYWNLGNGYGSTQTVNATNIVGGAAGAVLYQSGAGVTGFTAAGTSGQVLTSAGTGAPTWTTPSTGVGGSGTSTYIPKFSASATLANSSIIDDGTSVYFKTADANSTSGAGGATVKIGTNGRSMPASSGTTQNSVGLRLASNNNDVLDFGIGSRIAWLQSSDLLNLGAGYDINLNPVGGNVGIGMSTAPTSKLDVNGNVKASSFNSTIVNSVGSNVIVGQGNVLASLTTGNNNVGVGQYTLNYLAAGSENLGMGYSAMYNTRGSNNVGLGHNSLWTNNTGNNNTAIGHSSGYNSTGSDNTFLGYNANSSAGVTNAAAIGSGATVTASNTIQLGNTSTTGVNTSGGLTANAAVTSEITSSFTIDANNAETYKGKIIICNPSAAITITFAASLPTGFNCMVLQKSADANKVTFAAGTSVTIKNRNNYTATAGNYALATIVHIGGNIIVTAGDMQ